MKQICLTFIFAILALMPRLSHATLLDIQQVKSKSGLTAWLVEDHSVPVISIKFSFKNSGAKHDPIDKQGLARMASNTMDEGAGDLDANTFQKQLNDYSISLSFTANRDRFGGSVKTLSKNKTRALTLLNLALTRPRFDSAPVARMRQANQSRIRASLSNPNWIAQRLMNDVAYAGHPYAQNSGGTLSSLEKITPDDLRAFHRTLTKNNLVISASGDITADELSRAIDSIFSDLPQSTSIRKIQNTTLQNTGRTFVYNKEIPQTIVKMIQPGVDHKSPDYHTANVMNFILGSSGFGSRLTKEIREKRGLTYGIYSSMLGNDHIDTLSVSTSTANDNVPEMLSLINAQWERMAENSVSEKELNDAKSYLIGSLPLSLTSTDKIAGLLLSLQINNRSVDYLEQRKIAIESVTTSDIKTLAERLLDKNNFTTILVGSPPSIESAVTISGVPNAE